MIRSLLRSRALMAALSLGLAFGPSVVRPDSVYAQDAGDAGDGGDSGGGGKSGDSGDSASTVSRALASSCRFVS